MKYEDKTYGKGWSVKVDPGDRCADVLHYLMFGTLLGGRSLDGVTWTDEEPSEAARKSAKRLAASMRMTKEEIIKQDRMTRAGD